MILKRILPNTKHENVLKCWPCILLEIDNKWNCDKIHAHMRSTNTGALKINKT